MSQPLPRVIAYLRLSGFYAGVARLVEGVPPGPLLVGRRGQLLEASRDLAGDGLRPGLSRREASYAAPGAPWVECAPERFRPAAEAFWQLCLTLTPRVEPVADHKVFLDLTGAPGLDVAAVLPPALAGLAATLRRTPGLGEVRLQAGLGTNRLVARLAAGRVADEGCLAVPAGAEASFAAPFPPSALWTLSPAVKETCARLGLKTLEAVRAVPEPVLHRLCGPEAFPLGRAAWGRDETPVPLFDQTRATRDPAAPRRLVQEVPLPPSASGWAELAAPLRKATGSLARELTERGQACLRLRLTLDLAGGERRAAGLTPREPLTTAEALFAAAAGEFRRLLDQPGESVHPLRAKLEAEVAQGAAQLLLFPSGPPGATRPGALTEVLTAVNRVFSAEVLFPAARLDLSRRERLRRLLPGFGYAGP
jgi:nucleotidyltransferase/DNA polymerase involved in DNA repair